MDVSLFAIVCAYVCVRMCEFICGALASILNGDEIEFNNTLICPYTAKKSIIGYFNYCLSCILDYFKHIYRRIQMYRIPAYPMLRKP